MFATALALISQEFHGKERGTAFGIWGATIGAAVAIGPLVGGVLTSWLSWRWIFLVNIPIGVAAVVLAAAQAARVERPEHSRLDPLGLVTLIGGLFCLILALIEGNQRGWSSGVDPRPLRRGRRAARRLRRFADARHARRWSTSRSSRRPAFVGAQTPRSRSPRRCSRCSST